MVETPQKAKSLPDNLRARNLSTNVQMSISIRLPFIIQNACIFISVMLIFLRRFFLCRFSFGSVWRSGEKNPNGPREIWNFWLKSTFVHCLDFNDNTICDETKPKWLTLSRWRCAKNSENGVNFRVSFGSARNPTALCKSIFTPEIQTGNMKANLFVAHSHKLFTSKWN